MSGGSTRWAQANARARRTTSALTPGAVALDGSRPPARRRRHWVSPVAGPRVRQARWAFCLSRVGPAASAAVAVVVRRPDPRRWGHDRRDPANRGGPGYGAIVRAGVSFVADRSAPVRESRSLLARNAITDIAGLVGLEMWPAYAPVIELIADWRPRLGESQDRAPRQREPSWVDALLLTSLTPACRRQTRDAGGCDCWPLRAAARALV